MLMGPLDSSCPWSTEGIEGLNRFIQKAWKVISEKKIVQKDLDKLTRMRHKTIKKVTQDIERFNFNTAISALMVYLGEIAREEEIPHEDIRTFILLLSPFAPHFAEESWELIGEKGRILQEKWPDWDEVKTVDEMVSMGVQVNGKLRGTMEIETGAGEEEIRKKALSIPNVQNHVQGKTIHKVIITKQVINIVVK